MEIPRTMKATVLVAPHRFELLERPVPVPQNLSACDGVNCGQPSLSPDGRRIAFVKAGG